MSKSPLISCCFNSVLSGWEQKPESNLHAEVRPKPKLNPRSCGNKEEEGKFLREAAAAADLIPTVSLTYPASVDYLNRQRINAKLRWWNLEATVDLGFVVCD